MHFVARETIVTIMITNYLKMPVLLDLSSCLEGKEERRKVT
jgi:hypothetical protein